jgi:hypothetical protein
MKRYTNDRKKLRELLSNYFSKDQLLGFCIDHDEFIKLHETLSKHDVETEQVAQRIIMKAYQEGLLDQIHEWAQRKNPNRYNEIFQEIGPVEREWGYKHILHLSDLHFSTIDNATNWYSQLAEDLQDLDCDRLDGLFLSGDIANKSIPEEYAAAQQFLNNLRQEFKLTPKQIVIVPGNHDLNLELAENAYELKRRKSYKGSIDNNVIDKGEYIEVRNQEEYQHRFKHFSDFYKTVKGEPYPLEYAHQSILHHFEEQNLLILGLNSAWQLDHYYTSRASICPDAISHALRQIRQNSKYKNCLKFAVWHHPLNSAFEDCITDLGFMQRLSQAGFCVVFHGHIHKAETSLYRYDHSKDGRKLNIVCAGTFGAPVREWVPGYPLQYNLLKLKDDKLTVHTRCRKELNGAWQPDAIWTQGPGQDPKPRYEIEIPGQVEVVASKKMTEIQGKKGKEDANMEEGVIGKHERKLHTVIIGIDYQKIEGIRTLHCPVKEAKAFHQLLCNNFSEYEDNFVLMTDDDDGEFYTPTLKNIKRELGDELPRRSTENDFVIIYFSGHGTPEIRGGQELPSKYLVPVDGNTSRVYSTCYNLETDLIDLMNHRGLKAAGVWIILDCCFSGGVGGKTLKGPQYNPTKWLSQKFTEINLGSGWQILSACEDNEVAKEGKPYSVLTQALIETLIGNVSDVNITTEKGVKMMTFNVIHDAIRIKVRKLNPEQHPVVTGRNCGLKFPVLKKP